jgi:hypothetical protein
VNRSALNASTRTCFDFVPPSSSSEPMLLNIVRIRTHEPSLFYSCPWL